MALTQEQRDALVALITHFNETYPDPMRPHRTSTGLNSTQLRELFLRMAAGTSNNKEYNNWQRYALWGSSYEHAGWPGEETINHLSLILAE